MGALSPVNHKGLHQGWTQTSLYLQVIRFTSRHTTSHVYFLACLHSAGTQHRNLPLARWPILFCGPTQKPCVSHSQHRKNREGFGKKCRRMDRKGRNKQGRNPWQYVWLYTDLLQALKGERLSSVFSPDGTLISASAAPHCGTFSNKSKFVHIPTMADHSLATTVESTSGQILLNTSLS